MLQLMPIRGGIPTFSTLKYSHFPSNALWSILKKDESAPKIFFIFFTSPSLEVQLMHWARRPTFQIPPTCMNDSSLGVGYCESRYAHRTPSVCMHGRGPGAEAAWQLLLCQLVSFSLMKFDSSSWRNIPPVWTKGTLWIKCFRQTGIDGSVGREISQNMRTMMKMSYRFMLKIIYTPGIHTCGEFLIVALQAGQIR